MTVLVVKIWVTRGFFLLPLPSLFLWSGKHRGERLHFLISRGNFFALQPPAQEILLDSIKWDEIVLEDHYLSISLKTPLNGNEAVLLQFLRQVRTYYRVFS